MRRARLRVSGISILVLIGSLSGCATFEKGGFAGCTSDQKITANIRAALDQHPDLAEPNSIGVQTLNHVAYLLGSVSEGAMRATAESVARNVKGVTRVEDTIYVIK